MALRRAPALLLASLAAALWLPASAVAEDLVVGGAAPSQALERAGAHDTAPVTGLPAQVVQAPASAAPDLRDVPGVRYVEPNFHYGLSALPDDALIAQQWSLARANGIDATTAWNRTVGGSITVAVVDTGVDLGHPDLAQNLWTNPREIPGNGVDDDGNGYVDDVHGYDFAGGSGDPSDQLGHGTAVAGVIAARGDNRIGVAGVAWRARIMALKVVDAGGTATADRIAEAIRYAGANGARVVNVSLNGPDRSQVIEDAIQAVQAEGVLVVASAGNDGQDLGAVPSYPASYPEDDVLTVGSVGQSGGMSGFSNRGAPVDVYAPGEDVLSTAPGDTYDARVGTSVAAPHVTGTLALLAAAWPGASAADLRSALASGMRHGPDGLPVLDAAAALRAVPGGAPPPTPRLRLLRPRRARAGHRIHLRWRQLARGARIRAYRVTVDGRTVVRRSTSLTVRLRPGRCHWRVTALDAAGHRLGSRAAAFRVGAV
jgi:subtilisin family serine protease